MADVVTKRLEAADEVRRFEKGSFELVRVGTMTIGRARYEPSWKWSVHVGPAVGKETCDVEHVGMVLAGHAKVRMNDGREFDFTAGDVFHVGP